MATELKNVKRLYSTTEVALSPMAKQWGYAADTRRIMVVESDGITKRYYWDATRLADQTTSYGTAIIGTQGITGITPAGGSSGAASTLQAMLTGLANKIGAVVAGTIGNYSKFTAADTLGNGLLSESGNIVILNSSVDGPTLHAVQNTNAGVGALAGYLMTSDGLSATIYAASAATTNTLVADRLNISSGTGGVGINFNAGNATDLVKTYFGTPAAGTLFHTLSNKGLKLENIVLSTDADGTVAGINHAFSLTKNDSNTRAFTGHTMLATLNAGGSNTNTTLTLLILDTVNTATTGVTVDLFSLKYGGSARWKVNSFGVVCNGNSSIESTGATTPTMTNAPALVGSDPYTWIKYRTSDNTECVFPVWKFSS